LCRLESGRWDIFDSRARRPFVYDWRILFDPERPNARNQVVDHRFHSSRARRDPIGSEFFMVITRAPSENQGISLVEILLVMAGVALLVTAIPRIVMQTQKFYILGRTQLDLQREGRSIMYVLTRELRQASSDSIIIDRAPGQPYYSCLHFM